MIHSALHNISPSEYFITLNERLYTIPAKCPDDMVLLRHITDDIPLIWTTFKVSKSSTLTLKMNSWCLTSGHVLLMYPFTLMPVMIGSLTLIQSHLPAWINELGTVDCTPVLDTQWLYWLYVHIFATGNARNAILYYMWTVFNVFMSYHVLTMYSSEVHLPYRWNLLCKKKNGRCILLQNAKYYDYT